MSQKGGTYLRLYQLKASLGHVHEKMNKEITEYVGMNYRNWRRCYARNSHLENVKGCSCRDKEGNIDPMAQLIAEKMVNVC
jgi:hypothetical protein